MSTFIFASIFLIILIFSVVTSLKYKQLKKRYFNVKNDTSKMLIAFKRLRYGDINVRIDNLYNTELENVANRLFETIADRELMIKEYQQTLSSKNLSLEEIIKNEKQLQQFKEEFIATLTHDMKVPVIAELNSINFLLEGRFGDLNEKQKRALELMNSSSLELKELIENMLETFRLEQKKLELNIKEHNINDFINSIIDEMQPILLKTNHRIVISLNETNSLIAKFDDFQIRRVIKNLLQNAISFSPISEDIILKTNLENDLLNVCISNKGVSISKEELELIFHKYYSGHSKFRKAGTGLGLFISQQIALAHKGKIQVITEEKNKNTFILSVPLNL